MLFFDSRVCALALLGATALLAPSSASRAQTLVKDINTQPAAVDGSSDPKFFAVSRNRAFFQATSAEHGPELWVTDGSSAGTRMLKDIRPGIDGSRPHSFLVSGTHNVYFVADDGVHGEELWVIKPDLSVELLKDIRPGPRGSSPTNFTLYQTRAMFSADDGTRGRELWSSDGSANGTRLVSDISLGTASSSPGEMIVYRQWVYFGAHVPGKGRELWRSNGTTTQLWLDIHSGAGDSDPKGFCLAHDRIYFQADDGKFGFELWSTSRFANDKVRHSDINPLGNSTPQEITNLNGTLYFRAFRPSTGFELYRYTRLGGAKLAQDIRTGSASATPRELTIFQGTLFFTADDDTNGRELWFWTSSAQRIDIVPGKFGAEPRELSVANGVLYYSSRLNQTITRKLWRTAMGASQFETRAVDSTSMLTQPLGLTSFGTGILTSSYEKPQGAELCFATKDAQTRIKNIFVGATESSGFISKPLELDGLLLFQCDDGVHGRELWRSDGTSAGTYMLADIEAGSGSSHPTPLAIVGDALLFTAVSGALGRELWRTDGTTQGTSLVADINPGSADGTEPLFLRRIRRQPYALFRGSTLKHGKELWRTDGTAAGTALLRDIRPGPVSSNVQAQYIHDDLHLLFADDGVRGYELWRSRGTSASTTLLREFVAGANGLSWPSQVVAVAGTRAILSIHEASNSFTGAWSSDGTASGTISLNTSMHVSTAISSGPRVFYWDNTFGGRCHVTDGTLAGTRALTPIMSFQLQDPVLSPHAVDDALFVDPLGKLWRTDGTSAGSGVFVNTPDLRLGSFGRLTSVGTSGIVAFAAGLPGLATDQLWTSDGTPSGTVQHLASATQSPLPRFFKTVGDKLFFAARRVDVGHELWVMPLSAIGASNTISYGTGCAGKAGTPRISSSGLPRVGKLLDASVTNATPNSVAIFALGVQRTRIPSSGCQILTLPILTLGAPTDARGTSTLRIPIPNEASWLGRSIFTQAFVLEQGARWAGWFALSQGQQAVVGR